MGVYIFTGTFGVINGHTDVLKGTGIGGKAAGDCQSRRNDGYEEQLHGDCYFRTIRLQMPLRVLWL